jgi:hypothetical protein
MRLGARHPQKIAQQRAIAGLTHSMAQSTSGQADLAALVAGNAADHIRVGRR